MWTIIAVYSAAIILAHLPFVQGWLGKEVSAIVAKKLNTKVKVDKVHLGFLNRVVVDGLELYDQKSELMLKASRLAAKIDYGELVRNGRVYVSSAQLFGLKGVFYKANGHEKANFQFVLDSLASKDKTKKSDLKLSINSLIIRHGAIKYDRYDIAPTPSKLNLAHIDIKDISAHIIVPYYSAEKLEAEVKKLSFKEASGLNLKKLKFNFSMDNRTARLTEFELALPATDLNISRFTAEYGNKEGNTGNNDLRFNGEIDQSKITPRDVACLVPSFKNNSNPIYVTAAFDGTRHNMNISRLEAFSHDGLTSLTATGRISKNKTGTAWHADIKRFRCTAQSIDEMLSNSLGKNIKLPEMLMRLGGISYTGGISGTGGILSAEGTFTSDIGKADIKVNKNEQRIDAHVNTNGLNLKHLLDNDKLGMLATTVNVSCNIGKAGISDLKVNGIFPRLDYNGYSYAGIKADGTYDKSTFSGSLSIDDPNGQISLEGTTHLSSAVKSADIVASVRNLDPASLNITDKWKGAKFSLDVNADMQMSETDANIFNGEVKVTNLSMLSPEREYRLDSLNITARHGHMAMRSDFGHAELSGVYKLKTLANSFVNMLNAKMPTFFEERTQAENQFTLNAEITNSDILDALLGVPLKLDAPLGINAYVDDAQKTINVTCQTDRMFYDESPYENVSVSASTTGGPLSVDGKVRKIMANGHKLDLGFTAAADSDRLTTSINWDNNQEKLMAGEINAETRFIKNESGKTDIDINVKPSEIYINDTTWNVLPANIMYSGGNLAIEHFSIERSNQHIRIDGLATKQPTDSITIDLKDIDVSYVLGLINFHSVEFGGYMTGKAYVKSVFYEPDAQADLTINRFTLEGGRLGKLFAKVGWNKTDKQIDIDAHAEESNGAHTLVNGYVSPANKDIDLKIRAEGTNIEFIEGFCGSFMDNVEACAHGELRLHGPLKAMDLTGKMVADGKIRISPINVTYNLENDTIHFLPDNIVFRADTIRDRNGNTGIVDGTLHHQHLKNMSYDISIRTDNLLCYDTNGYGEDSFYGTAYGTGLCTIQGRKGQVNIDIDVTPDKDSFIEYNVASPDMITDQQFITWRDKTADTLSVSGDSIQAGAALADGAQQWAVDDIPSDIRINFIINMTPEATLRILMDKNTNDYIALNGNGTVRASYFNKGSFNMFGTFVIDHGVYTLTIQNIIKKVFQFQQGSSIVFSGNPYNAMLNLQAVYTVNGVPLSDLQLGNSFSSNNVRVDCLMNISGTPKAPHIDFNIDMPTVSEDAEQMVRTVINSEEEMNQQVVYLLGVGRFYMQGNNNSSDQGRQNQTSLAMQSLLSGTISQQINTLLGSLTDNNNWTFGANISTGDDGFNNAEYEGLLSGRLLDNRLIINGQFGYRDNENATTSFIGDFDINYLLTPNGNISLKVYNQTNDRYFTKSSLNTQGIGIMLKKDFNSLMELFGYKRKKKIQTTTEK